MLKIKNNSEIFFYEKCLKDFANKKANIYDNFQKYKEIIEEIEKENNIDLREQILFNYFPELKSAEYRESFNSLTQTDIIVYEKVSLYNFYCNNPIIFLETNKEETWNKKEMGELNLSNIILYAKNNNSNKVLLKGLINIGIQYGTILELDINKITESRI